MGDLPALRESLPDGEREAQFNAVFRTELKLVHRRRENTGSSCKMRAALIDGVEAERATLLGQRSAAKEGLEKPAVPDVLLDQPPDIGDAVWSDAADVGAPLRPVGASGQLNGDGAVKQGDAPRTKPHPYNLIGLALSGGGIRSASVCIGVAGALDKHGVLRHVDYISSVSGGGYAGCSLASSWYGYWKQQKAAGQPIANGWFFPFDHRRGVRENVVFQYLRAYANFLAPRGGSDFLYVPVMLLRGVFMNLMVLAPYLIVFAVALAFAVEQQLLNSPDKARRAFFCTVVAVAVVAAVMLAVSRLLRFLLEKLWSWFRPRHRSERDSEVINSLAAKGDKWPARDAVRRIFTRASIAAAAIIFIALQPWLVWLMGPLLLEPNTRVAWVSPLSAVGAIAALMPFISRFLALPEKLRHLGTVTIAVVVGPLFLWFAVLLAAAWLGRLPLQALPWIGEMHVLWLALAAAGLVFLANQVYLYDANEVSLHSVYRDKLSKAFLVTPTYATAGTPAGNGRSANLAIDPPNGVIHLDGVKLSQMELQHAPYPLINAALNVQVDPSNKTRGRQAAVFMFSPRFVGSDLTGYCRTKALEATNRRFTMASAMAISGAAAAPNSGRGTMKPVRFLLALMNVRMGYWLANPRRIALGLIRHETKLRPWRVPAERYLQELFGSIGANDRVVNLSDGGHIENLGIYELLRRRCKLIIAVDAEEDPKMSFASLGDLIRFARMDMAIQIDIDLADVRRVGPVGQDALSKNHMAVGEIDYGDGGKENKGLLVYLKSSLTGDEGEALNKYKAAQPLFPHHPTVGDQFYDEEQFEAYRSLGYHIADKAFARFGAAG